MVNIDKDRKLEVDGCVLKIINGDSKKFINFPSAIQEFEEYKNVIIVRVHPNALSFMNENIFAVSSEGKIIWQVEKIQHMNRDSPYTAIHLSDGQLFAYNWDTCLYRINLDTGKIIDREEAR